MFEIVTTQQNDKFLRKKCEPVTVFDGALQKTVDEMYETMTTPDPETEVKGVGIAANQVGILKRIIIVTFNYETTKKYKVITMINPEIIAESKKKIFMEEGCLSVPGEYGKVQRAAKIKVKWQNTEGNWCEKKLDKWDARIFLHENDHLNGILFTDYL